MVLERILGKDGQGSCLCRGGFGTETKSQSKSQEENATKWRAGAKALGRVLPDVSKE